MPCAAAGDNMNDADIFYLSVAEGELREIDFSVNYSAAERIAHGFRLLGYFFFHEMLIAALFGAVRIPGYMHEFFVYRLAVGIEKSNRSFADYCNLAVLHDGAVACIFEQSRDIGGEIVLPAAYADYQRAVFFGGKYLIRMIAHQHCDGIRAAHALYDFQHGLKRISVIEAVEKLSENLRVGLRLKLPALLFKLGFEFKIVFDDAVMDEGDAPARTRMGMGVCIGRRAMGRPAGMTYTHAPLRGADFVELLLKVAYPALRLDSGYLPVSAYGDARRIVTSVLQLLQTIDQYRRRTVISNVTNNSTHILFFLYKNICALLSPLSARRRAVL